MASPRSSCHPEMRAGAGSMLPLQSTSALPSTPKRIRKAVLRASAASAVIETLRLPAKYSVARTRATESGRAFFIMRLLRKDPSYDEESGVRITTARESDDRV